VNDLDMLYDYYKDVNLAAGAYAAVSSRIKDDKLENEFRDLTKLVLLESRQAAGMIIKLGGTIF
jgi:hypothetical protein